MAKFKKRETLQDDISVDDFLGTETLPAKKATGADSITVGLSIEEIQQSTKNLVLFKSINEKQLLAVTENDQKRVLFLSHLHQWKEQAGWIAGRLLTAIKKQVDDDFNKWSAQGEKPDKKPEYTSFNQWIEHHQDKLGFGKSSANQYMWLYGNVEFEKASLGVKKQKIINSVNDEELKQKIENEALKKNLTIDAIKNTVDKYKNKLKIEKEKEKKIKQVHFNIGKSGNKVTIECEKDDVDSVIQAIQKFEDQIKLYAQGLKEKESI